MLEAFGRWDILVNTAGLIARNRLAETTEDEFDRSFAINARIPFFLMREAASRMADQAGSSTWSPPRSPSPLPPTPPTLVQPGRQVSIPPQADGTA